MSNFLEVLGLGIGQLTRRPTAQVARQKAAALHETALQTGKSSLYRLIYRRIQNRHIFCEPSKKIRATCATPKTRGRSNLHASHGHNFVPARSNDTSLLARIFYMTNVKSNGDSPASSQDLGPIGESWTEEAQCGQISALLFHLCSI